MRPVARAEHRRASSRSLARGGRPRRQPGRAAAPLRAAGAADRGDGEGRPEPARPGPARLDRRRRRDRGGGADRARLPADDAPARGRAAAGRVGGAAGPGGGAGAGRARPPRRGQPVADRAAAAARGGARGGAAGARGRSWRRPRRSPTRRCGSCSRSPASCARPRSTTSAWPRRSPARSSSSRRGEIEAELAAEGDFSDLDDDVQLVVYRVAQEALSNAARHSGAERVDGARCAARGRRRRARRSPTTAAASPSSESERGLGIAGMRERALLIGGELTIESRPGHGTTRPARRAGRIDR